MGKKNSFPFSNETEISVNYSLILSSEISTRSISVSDCWCGGDAFQPAPIL